MSERLKELRDKQNELVAQARAALDEITDADESRAKELEEQHDRAMAEFDKLEARAKREEDSAKRAATLAERAAELEEIDRSKRPGAGDKREAKKQEDVDPKVAQRDAFSSFLRFGFGGLSEEHRQVIRDQSKQIRAIVGDTEARAQGVATAGAGGALVPEDYMAEIIMAMADYGPMNDASVVRLVNTSTGADLPWPTDDDTANKGALIAENTQVTEQDVTLSSKTLEAYKYTTKLIRVSNELLQDSAFDMDSYLQDKMTERVGRILNQHFTTGTGSSQPNGIVTASTAGVEAASATTLTADELIDLEHSVDPAYRRSPSCRFMFNDTTFKVIRKLKDGDGNYLWQAADIRAGAPSTILGYPFSINQDMDSFGDSSPATDNRPVIFGDFNKYVVRMVKALAVRRLAERYADFDQVGFVGFMRADAELMDTAAIKHLYAAE